MKFKLVRHGEVEDGQPGLESVGHDDPNLTPLGRRQAAAMAREILEATDRGESVEAVYSSPLRAARMTAEALSAVLDVGDVRVASELTTLTPEMLPEDDVSSLQALQSQAWDLLMSLKPQFDQQATVILVTHNLTIRALICRALEMPLQDAFRFELEPASLSTIEFRLQRDRERTLVAGLNDTCHVDEM